MAETLEQQKARQKQNSLNEQLEKFRKTGKVTKGMQRAGYFNVAPREVVVKDGESPFSLARDLLGSNASQAQIAAFAQAQGWTQFRAGQTVNVRGLFVTPRAAASNAYFEERLGIPQNTPAGSAQAPNTPTVGGELGPRYDVQSIQSQAGQTFGDPRSLQSLQGFAFAPPIEGDGVPSLGSTYDVQSIQSVGRQPQERLGNVLGAGIGFPAFPAGQTQQQAQPQSTAQPIRSQPSYTYTTPTGSVPPQAPTTPQTRGPYAPPMPIQQQAELVDARFASTTPQIYISREVDRAIPWGESGSPYIPVPGRPDLLQLNPAYVNFELQNSGYLGILDDTSAPVGAGDVIGDPSRSGTLGISPYVRPRRGGVGDGGQSNFRPANDPTGAVNYNTYRGGYLSSWRVGF